MLVATAACAGKAPANKGDDTPEPDAAATPDSPILDPGQMLSGKAMDYFANAPTPVASAMVETDGITPPVSATSAVDGLYAMMVPTGSKLFLTAKAEPIYIPTRNQATTIEGMPVVEDIYLMALQEVKNRYTLVGKTWDGTGACATCGFVTADLKRNNGMPLVDIPLANVQLLDTQDPPQPIAGQTPYFYNANGQPDAAELTSKAYNGRARVAFFDVPEGNYQLAVTYPNGGANDVTERVSISIKAKSAVLTRTGNQAGGGGAANNDPKFSTDIYPKLQTAAKGGLGCANCHTAGGPLPYDGEVTATLDSIKAAAGVLDLVTPANSLFLVKPLYEQPPMLQNHPNATFIDVNDLDYKLFLLWIQNGAKP